MSIKYCITVVTFFFLECRLRYLLYILFSQRIRMSERNQIFLILCIRLNRLNQSEPMKNQDYTSVLPRLFLFASFELSSLMFFGEGSWLTWISRYRWLLRWKGNDEEPHHDIRHIQYQLVDELLSSSRDTASTQAAFFYNHKADTIEANRNEFGGLSRHSRSFFREKSWLIERYIESALPRIPKTNPRHPGINQ